MFQRRRPDPPGAIPVANSALRVISPANPNSETVDEFDCGDRWFETEINETVHNRKWDITKNPDVTSLEFYLNGESVGFAFIVNKKYPTPWWDSASEDWVRYLYTIGVNRKFQGQADPGGTGSLAESMMRYINDELPREVVRGGRPNVVVGLYLTVYEENRRAIKFYDKFGLKVDHREPWATGPRKAIAIAMRKLL